MSDSSSQRIGKYQIAHLIAVGDSANLYSVLDENDNRFVIKVANSVAQNLLIENEFRCLTFLRKQSGRSEHIPRAQDFGFDESGNAFIVFSVLTISLFESLTQSTDTIKTNVLLKHLVDIGNTIEFLHAHDVIHADIHPKNVMIDGQSHSVLIDFSHARFKGQSIAPDIVQGTYLPHDNQTVSVSLFSDYFAFGKLIEWVYDKRPDLPVALEGIIPSLLSSDGQGSQSIFKQALSTLKDISSQSKQFETTPMEQVSQIDDDFNKGSVQESAKENTSRQTAHISDAKIDAYQENSLDADATIQNDTGANRKSSAAEEKNKSKPSVAKSLSFALVLIAFTVATLKVFLSIESEWMNEKDAPPTQQNLETSEEVLDPSLQSTSAKDTTVDDTQGANDNNNSVAQAVTTEANSSIANDEPASGVMFDINRSEPQKLLVVLNNQPHEIVLVPFQSSEQSAKKKSWVMQTEVSQAMWESCVQANVCESNRFATNSDFSDSFQLSDFPAVNIDWYNIQEDFIPFLKSETGLNFSLPKVSQWQVYSGSARAEIQKNELSMNCTDCGLSDYGQLVAVRNFALDASSLYHVYGNVREWTEDCGVTSTGSELCYQGRVVGGSWQQRRQQILSSPVGNLRKNARSIDTGFRLVID